MQVELAKESGFCFGVRRALQMATETLKNRPAGTVYCLGPLIHNPQEVARLAEAGLKVVEKIEQIESGTVVLRSHGVTPEVVEAAGNRGIEVVDATCPLVKRVQELAARLANEGYRVLIVGDGKHPEVQALLGHCPQAEVVSDEADIEDASLSVKVGLVAQTTESPIKLRRIVSAVLHRAAPEVRVFNTVCEATIGRREAARELAARVDVMIVLGGRNSANTTALAEICRSEGARTLHLETTDEAKAADFAGCRLVGVTAGASTPDWVIRRLVEFVENLPAEAKPA